MINEKNFATFVLWSEAASVRIEMIHIRRYALLGFLFENTYERFLAWVIHFLNQQLQTLKQFGFSFVNQASVDILTLLTAFYDAVMSSIHRKIYYSSSVLSLQSAMI